jgi:hypothetical protein
MPNILGIFLSLLCLSMGTALLYYAGTDTHSQTMEVIAGDVCFYWPDDDLSRTTKLDGTAKDLQDRWRRIGPPMQNRAVL